MEIDMDTEEYEIKLIIEQERVPKTILWLNKNSRQATLLASISALAVSSLEYFCGYDMGPGALILSVITVVFAIFSLTPIVTMSASGRGGGFGTASATIDENDSE